MAIIGPISNVKEIVKKRGCGVMVQFSDLTKAFVTYKELWGLEYKEEELISFIKMIPARI